MIDATNPVTEADAQEIRNEIASLKSEMRYNLRVLEFRLKTQIGSVILALGGVLIAVKFFQ